MTAISSTPFELLDSSTNAELTVGHDANQSGDRSERWSRADLVGISLSVLCAIHCAATPVLLAALPSMGLAWFESPWVHQVLFAGCFLLAGNAVLNGYRVHRKSLVPSVAVCGLSLLALSAFVFPPPCCAAGEVLAIGSAGSTATCESGCTHCSAHQAAAARESGSGGVPASFATSASDTVLTDAAVWSSASLSDWWLRLMTPIGGLLLIVAHGLNLRWVKSCRCGCCQA